MNTSLGILCCYGMHGAHRPDDHTQDVEQYYTNGIEFFGSREGLNTVVVSGGRTSTKSPKSEAEFACEYLKSIADKHNIRLVASSIGHSTSEDICMAIASMRTHIDSSTKIVIVCDALWYEKVTILTNLLIGDYLDFEIQGVERVDSHPHASREVQLLEAMPIEIQSDRFKYLCGYIQDILLDELNQEMMHLEEDGSTEAFQ